MNRRSFLKAAILGAAVAFPAYRMILSGRESTAHTHGAFRFEHGGRFHITGIDRKESILKLLERLPDTRITELRWYTPTTMRIE